jgi:hypothetical protein
MIEPQPMQPEPLPESQMEARRPAQPYYTPGAGRAASSQPHQRVISTSTRMNNYQTNSLRR